MHDPALITSELWTGLGNHLTFLWGFVGSVWVFGLSLLIALGAIPSLVATGHLPRVARYSQPLFFGSAATGAAAAVFFMSQMAPGIYDVLGAFWSRWFL